MSYIGSVNALVDNRSDPGTRRVLDDYCLERGWLPTRLGLMVQIAADADADAADDDARIRKFLTKLLTGDIDMREGLKLVQVPGATATRSRWSGGSAASRWMSGNSTAR